jgi:hypothetical protein
MRTTPRAPHLGDPRLYLKRAARTLSRKQLRFFWKGITMRKTLLILAAAPTLAVAAASPAYAGPRTYPGPGGYPYWSGYVDAPVGEPVPPCYWRTQRFWDGYAWRGRRVRICG